MDNSVSRCLGLLKQLLMGKPILWYPDTNKVYTLSTDAGKFAWTYVVTQSSLFKGSQLNCATLIKVSPCNIHVHKEISTLSWRHRCHIKEWSSVLQKLLQKNTLTSKVNKWAAEISLFKIKFWYIKGIKIL